MFIARRAVVALAGAAIATRVTGLRPSHAAALDLTYIPTSFHERAMRAAIQIGQSGFYPFGAVIVRPPSEELLARGANNSRVNPTYHGEIVCMNDYVELHGNQGWDGCVLYTTGEPCPMCMTALIWAGIGGVVYGTSIATLGQKLGLHQIAISASEVVAAASCSVVWHCSAAYLPLRRTPFLRNDSSAEPTWLLVRHQLLRDSTDEAPWSRSQRAPAGVPRTNKAQMIRAILLALN